MNVHRIAVALWVALIVAHAFCADAPQAVKPTAEEDEIVALTNQERKQAGLPALKYNAQLAEAARKHSANMAKQEKLEHVLDGKNSAKRVEAAGYKWVAARENIAFNQRSPKEVLEGWMGSEHHRENILATDISEIGVSIASDAQGQPYYTQVFAKSMADMVTVKFSVRNNSSLALTLDLGGGKPSSLKPGESSKYALSSADAEPQILIQAGELKLETRVAHGAQYKVERKGAGALELLKDDGKK